MKKTLIGLGCVLALLTSCKEKTPEQKIKDGAEEIQEGTSEKAESINKKTTKFFKGVKEDIKDATKK
jgi:hypothetical protein|tara:strand:+ start:370 stop:570 length:201 start_codon:yes stop_codon:yes gene_type:complete